MPEYTGQIVPMESGGAKPYTGPIVPLEGEKPKEEKGFLKSAWDALTAPGIVKETTPVAIGERLYDVKKATEEFNKNNEWDKERKRRVDAGESTNGMENWKLQRINEIVKAGKGEHGPDPGFKEIYAALKDKVTHDPGGLVGQVVRGVVTQPELFFLPEALPERVAEFVGQATKAANATTTIAKVAKTGAEAAQVGALGGAESALHQLVQRGDVNPKQVVADAAMMAAPVMIAKSIVGMAKTKGKDVPLSEAGKEVAKTIDEHGAMDTDKITAVMEKHGFDEDQITKVIEATKPLEQAMKDAVEAVKPAEEAHATEEGKVPQDGQQEHQRVEPQRVSPQASDSNRPVERPQVQEEKAQVEPVTKGLLPKEQEELTALVSKKVDNKGVQSPEDAARVEELLAKKRGPAKEPAPEEPKAVPPQLAMPEGVPHGEVLVEHARSILETAGMDAEEATKTAGSKPTMSTTTLRRVLTKYMGGQKYADGVLLEAVRDGKFGNLQSGKIDNTLLTAMGLTGLGAAGYAIYKNDPKEAMVGAIVTGGAIAAAALLKRSLKGIAEIAGVTKDTRYRIDNITDKYFGDLEAGRLANYRYATQVKTLVPNAKVREAMTHYLQGDESIQLPTNAKIAADSIRDYFTQMGEKGQKAGILPEELIDNYVTQLWTGLNKNDGVWNNLKQALGVKNNNTPGMSPRSRFGMERVIPSYKEGMAKGMIPSTLDVAEIMRIYGDNINKAVANKKLIQTLQTERTPWGESLVVHDTPPELSKQLAVTAARIDKQWQGGGDLAKDIRDMAIRKAPKEYVGIDHPQMRGMKVHQDIAPVVKWLFDANNPNAATKLLYGVSVAAKRGLFSYSLFHVKSLADALLGTSYKGLLKVVNGDAYKQLREGKAGDVLDELVRGGLKVVEKPMEGDVTPFSNALKLFEEKYPVVGLPVKGVRMVGQMMDSFLWSTVHPTFKSAAAMAAFEKILKARPELSRMDAAKAAASFTNDIFGGLDWFKIADGVQNKLGRDLALAVTSPQGRRFMQIMALAPDWTVATSRAMIKAIPGVSKREISALHQGYVVRSALLYFTVANALNQHFSGHNFWENEDPTMVDLGDGRKMQLSKHFMEPIHWLMKPGQQALNKLGYVPKQALEQAFNKQYLSTKGAPKIEGGAMGRVQHALSGVMPITGQQAFENGTIPALAGFFGFPVYGKTEEQTISTAKDQAKEKKEAWDKATPEERKKMKKPPSANDAAERARKRFERAQALAKKKREEE